MEKGTHTPGPWEQYGTLIVKSGENGGTICALSDLHGRRYIGHEQLDAGSKSWNEQMANARIIAAAPDLLAVCKALVFYKEALIAREYQPGSQTVAGLLRAAEEAITKAALE